MKKVLFQILLLSVFAFSAITTQAQTPFEMAQAALADEFDNPLDFEWEEDNGEFIATYFAEEGNIEVIFDDNGNWQQTSQNLTFESMPNSIKAAVKKLYPKAPPYYDMAISLQTIEAQKFLIGFETNTEMITLTFDENAKLLEKEAHPIDEDFD